MGNQKKPIGYENDLAEFAPVIFDGYSGEAIGWGFRLTSHLGNDKFDLLRKFGCMECLYPTWYLVTKTLSREEAIIKYGEITAEEFGPRGGWKSVTFGNTKFISKYLKPTGKQPD
jgi:hypothetical protein